MTVRARVLQCLLATACPILFFSGQLRAEVSATATARELALQGIDLVEHGDCERGQPLLEGAEKLHHATVHLQYLARCKAKTGHLVAATEMWRQIIREGAPQGASPAVAAAVVEATSELDRTLPKLAATTLETASRYPDLELVLDGAPLPNVVVGSKQVIDPGAHVLVVRARGYAPWTKRWTVGEGESTVIEIALSPAASGTASKGPAETSEKGAPGSGGSPLTTAGWITTTAGGAALVAGVVTWLTRNNRRSQLESDCAGGCPQPPDGKYTPELLAEKKQAIVDLTTATNLLMFGGGALVAGGVTMVLLGSRDGGGPSATLGPAIGRNEAGISIGGKW